ncbi:MAG TPA: hypothetical protein VG055_01815 [Planctomycetaceae bacterium]|nr:hypothetical protein [Planctomycetaceae bacterium]
MPTLTATQKEIFDRLEAEISETHYRWNIAKQLFVVEQHDDADEQQEALEKGMARYALMNQMAGNFFDALRDMMFDTVFLHICRLTERAEKTDKSGNVIEESIVIEQLRKIVDSLTDPSVASLAAELKKRHDDVKLKCAPLRKHRNKRISHLDMTTLSPATDVLPEITIRSIDDALKAICDFVNEFGKAFFGSTTYFQGVVAFDDGDSLIETLKHAAAFDVLSLADHGLYDRMITHGPHGKA